MVRVLALILVALVGLASNPRNDRSAVSGRDTPTASQIVERFITAVGGRSAWLKVRSQYAIGTMEVLGVNRGTFEVYAKAPNETLVVMRFENGVEIRVGFDGQRSWTQSQQSAARYDDPAKLAATKRDADFYKYLHFREHFPNAKVTGIAEVDNAKAYVVEATPAGEKIPERLYFDLATGLLVLRDTSRDDAGGKVIPDRIYYYDYRFVDAIKVAHTLRMIQGDTTIVTKHSNVKNNLAIDDDIFRLPLDK